MTVTIEKRDGVDWVVHSDLNGWARPATPDESALWAHKDARSAELEKDATRYRFLRDQNIEGDSFPRPGIFIGRTMPDEVLTEKDADAEIDAAIERRTLAVKS